MLARFPLVALSLGVFVGCSNPEFSARPTVTVFAAASLVTALDPIAADFEAAHDATVTISYAGSASLAQQIVAGADADIFITADTRWADEVAKARTVLRTEEALGNGLVLVVPIENRAGLSVPADLAQSNVTRIAIGEPASVPAGRYAKEALTHLGLWDSIQPKLVFTMDVRQALLYAERREVDAAIVYRTDAAGSTRVKVIAELDDALSEPVLYESVLFDTRNTVASEFFDELLSDNAMEHFSSAGFTCLLTKKEQARLLSLSS